MNTNERNQSPRKAEPAPPTGAEVASAVRDGSGRLLRRAGWGSAILCALVVAGVCAGGCGQRAEKQSASLPAPQPAVVTHSGSVENAAARTVSMLGSEPSSEALAAASVDSLPPDVAATVSDTRILAGTSVEITAQGSPDVVGVTLGDGNGSKAPFAYDPSADLWRVAYRVPVRPKSEKLALSVTARNASGRWRRVWVFMDVEKEAATADSVETPRP